MYEQRTRIWKRYRPFNPVIEAEVVVEVGYVPLQSEKA